MEFVSTKMITSDCYRIIYIYIYIYETHLQQCQCIVNRTDYQVKQSMEMYIHSNCAYQKMQKIKLLKDYSIQYFQ